MKKLLRKICRFLMKIMYIFPVNENKVYLMNFNGDKYGLDAKAFAEYLKEEEPQTHLIYWEILDPKRAFNEDGIKCVGKYSISGIYHYMTSGIILTNMTPRSYIPFRKKQYIINTWHGNPMKKVGKYAIRYNKDAYVLATCFASHSVEYSNMVLRDSFEYCGDILECGVPRNDIFFSEKKDAITDDVKHKLGIEGSVLLYAPTFRGDYQYEGTELDVQRVINSLQKKYKDKWTVLFRLHPQLADKISEYPENTIDVSQYSDIQELLLISDILITDYSSCAWDFAQTGRPVFLFATDLDKYETERGLYFPLNTLPYPLAQNNAELEHLIEQFDKADYSEALKRYFNIVGNCETGVACKTLLNAAKAHHKKCEML